MKLISMLSALALSTVIMTDAHAVGTATQEEFVQKASMSNLFEIESSKLAQERAQDPAVKDFANKMVNDHTKAGNDLKAAVRTSKLNNSLIVTALDDDHNDKITELREKSGKDFDQAYMDMQESTHDNTVDLFEEYAENGKNPQLKDFASKTLPVLKEHEGFTDKND